MDSGRLPSYAVMDDHYCYYTSNPESVSSYFVVPGTIVLTLVPLLRARRVRPNLLSSHVDGMDLERIKQNLRLRSGRSKKPPKKTKVQTPTATSQTTQIDTSRSASNKANGHVATLHAFGDDTEEQDPKEDPVTKIEKLDSSEQQEDAGGYPTPVSLGQDTAFSPTVNDQGDTVNDNQDQENPRESSRPRSETPTQKSELQGLAGNMNDPDATDASHGSEADDFDLRPPAPRPKPPSIESLAESLFSAGHLNTLIYNTEHLTGFTGFLRKYRPEDLPLLMRYLETAKAIKAIEYANAVAESAPALPKAVEGNEAETSDVAATFNKSFQESCTSAFNTLLNISLPLYITFTLVRIVSECLTDEITGRTTPVMREMVGGLSEVFCLTDPNQPDNPIIYASEEFYRLTGYGMEDVIGHNCRFLQGSKTSRDSTNRLRECLDSGGETYETLLNYRRDGKPFVNLLMIAPLHDGKGNIKYHIGAQVDVSGLIEGGRVFDAFRKYLIKNETDKKRETKQKARDKDTGVSRKRKALAKLRELSELFDLEESAVVQSHSRSSSIERDDDTRSIGSGNVRRRFLDSQGSDDDDEEGPETEDSAEKDAWKLGSTGPMGMSGKLPGVYEKYMLIRPAPSLRIVFVSPKLRDFGSVLQSPFLSHVAAPAGTLSGLAESFKAGIPVSAKINFMPTRTKQRYGTEISSNERHEDGKHGRACWMSATPLLGGDDAIGVWIIVFVEKAQAKAQRSRLNKTRITSLQDQGAQKPDQPRKPERQSVQPDPGPPGTNQPKEGAVQRGLPIKPKRLDDAIHITNQRQNSRNSLTAYQYQAATPVEEYHSADEDAEFSSPTLPMHKQDVAPQTPTYEIADEDGFVKSTPTTVPGPSPDRLRINPDSDQDGELSASTEESSKLETSGSSQEDLPQDPNQIPPSEPSERESTYDEDNGQDHKSITPSRSKTPETAQNFTLDSVETIRNKETPPLSPSRGSPSSVDQETPSKPTPTSTKSYKTHTARSSGTLPAGLGYMDYLKHPGTSRQVSGDLRRGRRKTRNTGNDNDPWSETDCATSPYSVD